MPSFCSAAVILRAYDYSEADRILVAFTRFSGKIRAVAKGVRKPGSRLAGCTSLLSLADLQFHGKEHQELYRLTQGQLIKSFCRIKSDLCLLGQAARMSELADRLTPDREPLPEIFDLLQHGLELLEKGVAPAVTGIWYEISLLDKTGYRPVLMHCMGCKQDRDTMYYAPEQGGVLCRACGAHSPLLISRGARVLLEKLRGLHHGSVGRLRLDPRMEKSVSALLHAALQYQLGRPLHSEKFQRAMEKVQGR
ncbi:DNA repair protein RecO [candidate division FCPU426 bacterium]|nr:DNA repair protein RecO [candidate division FCPU426 bacterium]